MALKTTYFMHPRASLCFLYEIDIMNSQSASKLMQQPFFNVFLFYFGQKYGCLSFSAFLMQNKGFATWTYIDVILLVKKVLLCIIFILWVPYNFIALLWNSYYVVIIYWRHQQYLAYHYYFLLNFCTCFLCFSSSSELLSLFERQHD